MPIDVLKLLFCYIKLSLYYIVKQGETPGSFFQKITCIIRKLNKKLHKVNLYAWSSRFFQFLVRLFTCVRLKAYFYTIVT